MGCQTKKLRDFGFATDNKVYVIAEIGLNHGGDLGLAKKLIDSAARTRADAVKFQTYIAEKRVAKQSPIFGILKKCELPFEAFRTLKTHAELKGIEFFSTPFDEESVDYLESIGCTKYKIASFDVVNQKLLTKIAATGKTLIMSVGMSRESEIATALSLLKLKTNRLALLHCISAYPTKEAEADLAAINSLKDSFDCIIGQSDHTADIVVPLYAVAAGAQIIEKHYRTDDRMDCVDAPVSITEQQMQKLIEEIRRLEGILGSGALGIREAEKGTEQFRRYSTAS